jgi:hypothetical protein
LPHQPPAAGAERGAERQLPPPRGRARELQVGDVGAGDEQDQRDEAQQDEQRLTGIPHEILAERDHRCAHAGVGSRELGRERPRDGGKVRVGLRAGHAGLEQTHGPEGGIVACEPVGVGCGRHRKPDLRRAERIRVVRRGHADHDVRAAVQHDRAADGPWIAAEAGLPGRVGEHGHEGPVAFRGLVVREQAAGDGAGAEQAKGVRRNEVADHPIGPLGARVVHGLGPNEADVRERPVAGAPFLEIGKADEGPVLFTSGGPEHEQSSGVRIRQRPEEHRAHRTVDGRVGGDGQDQREERDGREGGRPAQLAQRVDRVLPQLGEVFGAPLIALVPLPDLPASGVDRLAIAEAEPRLRARRLGAQPPLDQLASEHLHVKIELRLDLIRDRVTPEPGPELLPDTPDGRHALRPATGWGRPPR